MTPAARTLAVVAGIVCMLLAGAQLVRQAALAADASVVWPEASWWTRLTGDASWATTGVAAAVTGALAIFFVVVALRQLGERRSGPQQVGFSADDSEARVSLAGLERGMARRFEDVLPGSRVSGVALRKEAAGWRARFEAVVPADDVAGARERAFATLSDDLRRLGGMELVRLDLVITSLRASKASKT